MLMKILNLVRQKWRLAITVVFISLVSCKKNDSGEMITNPADEYINYTVNGTAYSYVKPADNLFADTLPEIQSFIPVSSVYGNRIAPANTDAVRISYNKSNAAAGSMQQLTLFATPQTEIYPYFASAASPVFVTITEYGNAGEFIAGNFSALLTGASPANIQYNIICSFRVKRRI
jgi:hypothetical protein